MTMQLIKTALLTLCIAVAVNLSAYAESKQREHTVTVQNNDTFSSLLIRSYIAPTKSAVRDLKQLNNLHNRLPLEGEVLILPSFDMKSLQDTEVKIYAEVKDSRNISVARQGKYRGVLRHPKIKGVSGFTTRNHVHSINETVSPHSERAGAARTIQFEQQAVNSPELNSRTLGKNMSVEYVPKLQVLSFVDNLFLDLYFPNSYSESIREIGYAAGTEISFTPALSLLLHHEVFSEDSSELTTGNTHIDEETLPYTGLAVQFTPDEYFQSVVEYDSDRSLRISAYIQPTESTTLTIDYSLVNDTESTDGQQTEFTVDTGTTNNNLRWKWIRTDYFTNLQFNYEVNELFRFPGFGVEFSTDVDIKGSGYYQFEVSLHKGF